MADKSFCHNVLCHKQQRKHRCSKCSTFICEDCSYNVKKDNTKIRVCPDCFVSNRIEAFVEICRELSTDDDKEIIKDSIVTDDKYKKTDGVTNVT